MSRQVRIIFSPLKTRQQQSGKPIGQRNNPPRELLQTNLLRAAHVFPRATHLSYAGAVYVLQGDVHMDGNTLFVNSLAGLDGGERAAKC